MLAAGVLLWVVLILSACVGSPAWPEVRDEATYVR
jgi:hypothetical protein